MTDSANSILESFDEVSETDKREVARAILWRDLRFDIPALTDEDLVAQADELFRDLDSCGENMKLKVVLEPSDEGGFTVYVPSLPGCVSEGDTEEEALRNIREAIELYLEPVDDDLAALGKEVREIVL